MIYDSHFCFHDNSYFHGNPINFQVIPELMSLSSSFLHEENKSKPIMTFQDHANVPLMNSDSRRAHKAFDYLRTTKSNCSKSLFLCTINYLRIQDKLVEKKYLCSIKDAVRFFIHLHITRENVGISQEIGHGNFGLRALR